MYNILYTINGVISNMDDNKKKLIAIKLKNTAQALEKNNFTAYCANNKQEAIAILKTLINKGESVGVGGSATLNELNVLNYLRCGEFNFYDRYAPQLSREETVEIMRQSLLADVFITSTNAVTENGELYNIDGNANRVAAMLFGPKSVIVVAGYNKIVKDIKEAEQRVKTIAAPANCIRLNKDTPCAVTGTCMDCKSENRICADKVVMAKQTVKGRVKIILVAEELGY